MKLNSVTEPASLAPALGDLMEAIVEQLPLAIFAKNPRDDYRIVLWNRMAEKLWGHTREEVFGKTDEDLFTPESAQFFRQKDKETIAGQQTVFIERELVESKYGRRWVRTWKIPLMCPHGTPLLLVGISQDLSEIVESEEKEARVEQELHFQREKLIHASRLTALGEVAGGIAHEMNTPLGVIALHAEVALNQIQSGKMPSAEELSRHFQKIQDTSYRLARIVSTVKGFSRISPKEDEKWVTLKSLIEDVKSVAGYRLKHEQISFRDHSCPKNLELFCQPIQMSQVFLNLLNNSMEAIGGIDEKWIEVSVKDDIHSEWLEIHFTDCGPGISSEVREHMFESFFTTKSEQQGTGLGLSISRNILDSFGGELSCDENCENTRMVLKWPRGRARHNTSLSL